MVESLVNFTDDEFESLMRERGLNTTTRSVVSIAQDELGQDQVSYDSLRDGTAPLLDLLPMFRNVAPEDRRLGDEDILQIFTNVQDPGSGPAAFAEGAARLAPETIAGGFGFSAGVRAAMPVANFIPAVGLPGVVAKGAVLLGGGIVGAISAAFAADEAEKAVIGEQAPIVPSLESSRRWGEGTMLGLSLLHAPWTLTSKAPQVSKNVEFLENFKNVASGRFAANLDDAAEFTAKNAGLSEKAFAAAQEAGKKLAEKGTMFGKKVKKFDVTAATTTTGSEIAFKRFNKDGLLFDPTLGPVGSRIGAQFEQGITQSLALARKRAGRFLAIESAAAGGAGLGAYVAQNIDPYDESSRFIGEILGAAIVPLPAEVAIESGPRMIKKLYGTLRNWTTRKEGGILDEQLKRDGGTRILKALQASEEYEGNEQIETLINGLINGDTFPRPVDEAGNIVPESPSKAARIYNLPLANTLANIETSLSKRNKELQVTAQKGKEQLLQNAKDAIEVLASTGEPAGVLAAARIQQGIFEEQISAETTSAVNKFMGALKKVRGDDPELDDDSLLAPSNAVELGKRLHSIMVKQIDASKEFERQLWSQTKKVKVNEFTAKNGKKIKIPNSLAIFGRDVDKNGLKFASKSGQLTFQNYLKKFNIGEDLEDFARYFGTLPVASTEAVPKPITKFEDTLRAAKGTQELDLFLETLVKEGVLKKKDASITSAMTKIPSTDDVIEQLGEMEKRYTPGKFDTKFESAARIKRKNKLPEFIRLKREALIAEQTYKSDLQKIDRMQRNNPVNTAKLFELRSNALRLASQLKKGQDPDKTGALFVKRLADAFEQDMMYAPDFTLEYNTARAYTFARNNVFTRSFYGELQTVDPDRSLRIEPEDFSRAFFFGGNQATAKRIQEINTAIKFGVDHGLDRENFDTITTADAVDFLIRDSLKKFTVTKPDGTVDINEARLRTWRSQPGTKELFQIFPLLETGTRLERDIDGVTKAKRFLEATNSQFLQMGSQPEVRVLNNIIDFPEKPLEVVSRAINGETPKQDLNALVNLISKEKDQFPIKDPVTGMLFKEEDVKRGLRMLIIDEAIHHAGGLGLKFDPTKFFQRLDEPIKGTLSKDNFNLMDFMSEKGLIDAKQKDDLTTAIARMRGVENAFQQGDVEDVLFKSIDTVSLFQARIIGATLGQKGQETFNRLLNRFGLGTTGGGIGGGIIAAEAGSEAVVNFLLRGPEKHRVKQMSMLFNDREALGLLLKEIKTEQDAREIFAALGTVMSKLARQTGRRLPYAGQLGMSELEGDVLPEPEVGAQSVPVEEEQFVPPAVPVERQAVASLPTFQPIRPPTNIQQVSPTLNPPGGGQPVNRQRFAALFPEDRDLIEGIGSLRR